MSTLHYQKRAKIVLILSFIFFGAVAVQFGVTMLGGDGSTSPGISIPTQERGTILDRNERILAIQTSYYVVYLYTPAVRDPDLTAQVLAQHLDMNAIRLAARIRANRGDMVVKREVGEEKARELEAAIEEAKVGGVRIEKDYGRRYPMGALGSHVLGFTGIDNRGLEGIEFALDDVLSPAQQSPTIANRSFGKNIVLTLDAVVQDYMEGILYQTQEENSADAAMLLVADAKTGEILAHVNLPDYDPNDFENSTLEERRNRIVSYAYEPGSVFKVFSMASVLSLGGIDQSTIFHTSGGYEVAPNVRPITDLSDYGSISLEGILTFSSNVGAAFASDTVSADSFYYLIRQFGFGQKTDVELQGESTGILRAPPEWSLRTKPTLAIGQELSVTALQMVQGATVIANGGDMVQLHYIKELRDNNGAAIEVIEPVVKRQVITADAADTILKLMNSATGDFGTARRAQIDNINLSVKTGTAQTFDQEAGSYSTSEFIASALAIFPTEDPELIVYAAIIHPRGDTTFGGRIAAPLIREAAEFLIPYYGIRRSGDIETSQDEQLQLVIPPAPVIGDTMPDLTGLALRSLLELMEDERFEVRISGSGWVVSQSPDPGTELGEGSIIELFLDYR